MPEHHRTREELWTELNEQRRGIASSSAAYDAGELWESKRLAAATYIVVHDGPGKSRSRSILTQLGIRTSGKFVSTAIVDQSGGVLRWGAPLCCIATSTDEDGSNPRSDDVPHLDAAQRNEWISFPRWWEEPVYTNTVGNHLSRKNLVCFLRDKEGGAHLDPSLPDSPYLDLKTQAKETLIVHKTIDHRLTRVSPTNAHLASMRQVAWELETSLISLIKQLGI